MRRLTAQQHDPPPRVAIYARYSTEGDRGGAQGAARQRTAGSLPAIARGGETPVGAEAGKVGHVDDADRSPTRSRARGRAQGFYNHWAYPFWKRWPLRRCRRLKAPA